MSWILHYVEHLFSEWDIRGYLKRRGQERECLQDPGVLSRLQPKGPGRVISHRRFWPLYRSDPSGKQAFFSGDGHMWCWYHLGSGISGMHLWTVTWEFRSVTLLSFHYPGPAPASLLSHKTVYNWMFMLFLNLFLNKDFYIAPINVILTCSWIVCLLNAKRDSVFRFIDFFVISHMRVAAFSWLITFIYCIVFKKRVFFSP